MGKHRKEDSRGHDPSHDDRGDAARYRAADEHRGGAADHHGGAHDAAHPGDRDSRREQRGRAPGSSYGGKQGSYAQGSYAQGNYRERGDVSSGRGLHDDAASWQSGAQDHWRQGAQERGGPGQGGYGELSYGQGGQRRGQGEGAYERGPEAFGQWQGGSRGGYGQPGHEPGSYGAGSYSQGEQVEGPRGQSSQGTDEAAWRRNRLAEGANPGMSGPHGSPHEGASRDTGPHHDPHYLKWREEQIRKLDADYEAFSQERYSRFADEFDSWRRERAAAGGTRDESKVGSKRAPGDADKSDGGTQDTGDAPKRR
ncbi:hypothetical protein Tbd_0731 [Thiobacillus denitrificans ATCC 25259]|uniref:Uncharacterized protein n=1 Tax=Thiobacillus denitrificans (strain ATCC 25259 / T1) TaxID=292415 RepID=Q3SF04_THIDA|nr:hypothetical protein [Thiobacillus denitrificans]AAZ96684.1 hypothetical protein Tbd_0731 [Thiobacillus denitrificans ATCC 25259]